jgi:hypothetical protein
MVIIRESDSEGGFSSIPPLGSATERQIYFQSFRWDGSFDEGKYVDEMLNLPVIEGDSDSSSSSSGSDSECIIIPRSSFTGKELVVFDPSGVTMFKSQNSVRWIAFKPLEELSNCQVLDGSVMWS